MNSKHVLIASAFLLLAACATPTAYGPADANNHTGYSDQRLADNRIRVTFRGNSATYREMVEEYLLLRSAEVTREAGYSWFAFDTRNTEPRRPTTPTLPDGGLAPLRGFRQRFDPLGRVETTIPTTRYEAYAEVALLTPDQAKREPSALRADDVIARLSPIAARSQQH